MINVNQYKNYILRPVLEYFDWYSEESEKLLLGTAATESQFGYYIHQVKGPALGLFQMEPKTHEDIWKNYLSYRPKLVSDILECCDFQGGVDAEEMMSNLKYATIMARLHYLRVREKIPVSGDILQLGMYYKKYYNTKNGKGSPVKFQMDYIKFIMGD